MSRTVLTFLVLLPFVLASPLHDENSTDGDVGGVTELPVKVDAYRPVSYEGQYQTQGSRIPEVVVHLESKKEEKRPGLHSTSLPVYQGQRQKKSPYCVHVHSNNPYEPAYEVCGQKTPVDPHSHDHTQRHDYDPLHNLAQAAIASAAYGAAGHHAVPLTEPYHSLYDGAYHSAPSIPMQTYSIPAYKAPAPAYSAPSYGAPAYNAPAYGAPAYGAPAYGAPAYGAPAYGAPAYRPPAYSPPPYSPPVVHSYSPSLSKYNYDGERISLMPAYTSSGAAKYRADEVDKSKPSIKNDTKTTATTPEPSSRSSDYNPPSLYHAPAAASGYHSPYHMPMKVVGYVSAAPAAFGHGAPAYGGAQAYGSPSQSYGSSYSAPSQSYGASYTAPSQSYGSTYTAPSQSYGSSYTAPSQSYGSSYSAPSQSYGASQSHAYGSSYSAPSQSYGSSGHGASSHGSGSNYAQSGSGSHGSYGGAAHSSSYGGKGGAAKGGSSYASDPYSSHAGTTYASPVYPNTAGYQAGPSYSAPYGGAAGYAPKMPSGYSSGYSAGVPSGYTSGYSGGMPGGYSSGYSGGMPGGYSSGYSGGMPGGYSSGYSAPYSGGYGPSYSGANYVAPSYSGYGGAPGGYAAYREGGYLAGRPTYGDYSAGSSYATPSYGEGTYTGYLVPQGYAGHGTGYGGKSGYGSQSPSIPLSISCQVQPAHPAHVYPAGYPETYREAEEPIHQMFPHHGPPPSHKQQQPGSHVPAKQGEGTKHQSSHKGSSEESGESTDTSLRKDGTSTTPRPGVQGKADSTGKNPTPAAQKTTSPSSGARADTLIFPPPPFPNYGPGYYSHVRQA